MLRTIEMDLVYQPAIDGPPPTAGNLYQNACRGDEATVNAWRDIWIQNTRAAKERFGSFGDKSIGKLHGINRFKPAIIIGSGPSLKNSIEALRENAQSPYPVMTVSCLHNFGYFQDEGFHADYYLSLDSGKIVVDDVFEGRKEAPEHYWEATKGKTLLATVASDPSLFEKWQGDIYLFSSLIPDHYVKTELDNIERFAHFISAGGNALGGCLYVAKAIFGSDVIHIVGGDFCFDYNNTFHAYKTHYDTPGQYVVWPDVYGNMRKTWASYLNFKFWFDHIACTIPGRWISCSEGLLGAYREGNIRQFQYMSLKDALVPYSMTHRIYLERKDLATKQTIERTPIDLKDLFSNPAYEADIVVF